MRLKWRIGSRAARRRKTPRVTYIPRIICRYAGCSGAQAQPLGQRRFNTKMPKMKMRPKILRTGRKRGGGDGAVIESSRGGGGRDGGWVRGPNGRALAAGGPPPRATRV